MDTVEILIFLPIALMMVALAFVILKGWGDRLIAGYNTASKEEQEKFNIKRLRIVVAAMILFVPALILVDPRLHLVQEKIIDKKDSL